MSENLEGTEQQAKNRGEIGQQLRALGTLAEALASIQQLTTVPTLGSGGPMPSFGFSELCRHKAGTWCMYNSGKKRIHKNKSEKTF